MPTLASSWFDKSITYIFEHSDAGAIGFVINRHTQMLSGDIYDQLKIDCDDKVRRSVPVFQGGPVDEQRGFILCVSNSIPTAAPHQGSQDTTVTDNNGRSSERSEGTGTDDYSSNAFGIGLSSSTKLLTELGQGQGPATHLLLLGYAGWAAGQLEAEVAGNSWLTCEATEDVIFLEKWDEKFALAAKSIGVDFSQLSGDAGHA